MTAFTFQKASKRRARARVALIGPSGSGKTYTALSIASAMGGRVAVIDTEHGSASKYADCFEFDVLELATFSPLTYVEAMKAAADYDVLVIDSLSHAWMGKDGALEQVDRAAKRDTRGNSFAAWRDVTPMHNALVEALTAHPAHLIVTMRSKTEYVLDKDERSGKTIPRKVGTAPVQRDGLEYEFDVVADLNLDHDLIVSKTRCPSLDGAVVNKAGAEVAGTLLAWLSDGADVPAPAPPAETQTTSGHGAATRERAAASAPGPASPVDSEPAPTTNSNGNRRGGVKAAIEAAGNDPAAIAALLGAIDGIGQPYHRFSGLRLWVAAMVENGRPEDLIVVRETVEAWPETRPARSYIVGELNRALDALGSTSVDAAPLAELDGDAILEGME